MQYLKGRYAVLEAFSENNIREVYNIEMDINRLIFFTERPKIMSFQKYVEYIQKRLRDYFDSYFVIRNKKGVVGYIYTYNLNLNNGYAYASINSNEQVDSRCAIAEGGIMFLDYLFRHFPLRKIYADVYEFNVKSIRLLKTAGFKCEAHLAEHRYFDGRYYALETYALYREVFYLQNQRILNQYKLFS